MPLNTEYSSSFIGSLLLFPFFRPTRHDTVRRGAARHGTARHDATIRRTVLVASCKGLLQYVARRSIRATRTIDAEKPLLRAATTSGIFFLIRSVNRRLPLVITFPPMLSLLLPTNYKESTFLHVLRPFLRTLSEIRSNERIDPFPDRCPVPSTIKRPREKRRF